MEYKIISYIRIFLAVLITIFILSPGIILDSYIRIGLGIIAILTFYGAWGLKPLV